MKRHCSVAEGGQEPLGKVFSLNRIDADGGVFGNAGSKYRREGKTSFQSPQGRSGPCREPIIKRGGYIGDGRKMYGLMMM